MKNNNRRKQGIMYSTNPNFEYIYEDNNIKTLAPNEQNLKICVEKKKAGKIAVIIKGYIGSNDDINALSKLLKTKCATGGSSKNGQIIIQGNLREKVMTILKEEGYNFKIVGG